MVIEQPEYIEMALDEIYTVATKATEDQTIEPEQELANLYDITKQKWHEFNTHTRNLDHNRRYQAPVAYKYRTRLELSPGYYQQYPVWTDGECYS